MRSFRIDKQNIGEIIILLWILYFAYKMTYLCGQRGFFAFDQSIIFDGSYRIASGQIPYKDFLIPFGPVVFWLQGIIFKIVGVSYASYIFGAAIINLLATAASYIILRLLFPQQKLPAYLGSALTAVWFYPPFGTPWPEQTAFFFSLIALLFTLTGFELEQRSIKGQRILYLFAGLATFIAFISKQNAGAFIVPIIALLFLVTNIKSIGKGLLDFALFSLGWICGLIAFGLCLVAKADITIFTRHFIEIPTAEVGAGRLPVGIFSWLQTLLIGSAPNVITLLSALSSLIALVTVFLFFRSKTNDTAISEKRLLAAVLIPSLFIFHNIFLTTSNNQAENSLPFIGLIAAIGLGLLLPWIKNNLRQNIFLAIVGISVIALSIWSFGLGAEVAYSRKVHSIFKNSTFPNNLSIGKLSAIKWGIPTRIGNLIPAEDLDQLVTYLEVSDENFFIFPDFTILYGTVGVPSPQPLLWFHNGLTYANEYDATLDTWIVADLIENQVRIIIIEEQSWFHTDQRLADFPLLQNFITDNYAIEEQIGNFIIYVQQD